MDLKKIVAIASIVLITGGIWYYKRHHHYVPKTAEEFFKRNKHLTRPTSRMALPPDQLRETDTFQEGDYQLMADHIYPVTFVESILFTQADQPRQEFESKGSILFKSLGLKKGRLVLLAEFSFSKMDQMKTMNAKTLEEFGILSDPKQKPSPEQILKRTLLVKLDPRGKVRELYVHSPKVTRTSLESRLKLLDEIFKKVATTKPGTSVVNELDDLGYPYKIRYTVGDNGNFLQINGTSDQDYGLNDSESKAAAAGAQGMGMFALKGKQAASMDWQWIKSEQRPRQQNSQGESELRIQNHLIAQFAGTTKINWGEASVDHSIEALAEKFIYPIDVSLLRAILRKQQNKAINKKTTVAAKNEKEKKLSPKEAHDKAFEKMTDEIKNNPAKIESFKQIALNSDPGSEGLSMALGALGYEGSEESQKALVAVYGRKDLTDRDRSKIFTELTLVQQALAPEVKQFLKDEFQKTDYSKSRTSKQAGLALGASISRDGDPETIRFFHDQWDNVSSQSQDEGEARGRQKYLLAVMGNSKSDVFMSEANIAGSSSDPGLRSAAADSIRFSQTNDSRSLLFDLLRDKNPEVRTMVVQSLRYQPFDERTKSALMACAGDSDVGVKINCYRGLSYNMNQPGIKEYLSGRASAETDPQVKRTLQEALSSEGSSQTPTP